MKRIAIVMFFVSSVLSADVKDVKLSDLKNMEVIELIDEKDLAKYDDTEKKRLEIEAQKAKKPVIVKLTTAKEAIDHIVKNKSLKDAKINMGLLQLLDLYEEILKANDVTNKQALFITLYPMVVKPAKDIKNLEYKLFTEDMKRPSLDTVQAIKKDIKGLI